MAFPSSLLSLLEEWKTVCADKPLTCVSDAVKELPTCFTEPKEWCLVAGGVCLLAILFLAVAVVCLRCFFRLLCRRRGIQSRPLPTPPGMAAKFLAREKKEIEKEKKARIAQEKERKLKAGTAAEGLMDIYSMSGIEYQKDKPLPDIGSRLEKYWYRVISHETYDHHILTIGYLSASFTCSLEVQGYINDQLSQLSHPYLQEINDIRFLQSSQNKPRQDKPSQDKPQVAIVQPYWEKGSLKDLIYKADPLADWAQKYNKVADPLPAERVSLFGGQILQAVMYLYGRGYNPLGHIQTGNIYIQSDDACKLGGYENMLLKNRARLHRTCANFKCLDAIDIIMFGHVIYEMSAGKELAHLVPNEEEYSFVISDQCKEVLQYIFTRNAEGVFVRSMKEIQAHRFFNKSRQRVQASVPIPKQNSVSPPVTSKASKIGFLSKKKNKKQNKT